MIVSNRVKKCYMIKFFLLILHGQNDDNPTLSLIYIVHTLFKHA